MRAAEAREVPLGYVRIIITVQRPDGRIVTSASDIPDDLGSLEWESVRQQIGASGLAGIAAVQELPS